MAGYYRVLVEDIQFSLRGRLWNISDQGREGSYFRMARGPLRVPNSEVTGRHSGSPEVRS